MNESANPRRSLDGMVALTCLMAASRLLCLVWGSGMLGKRSAMMPWNSVRSPARNFGRLTSSSERRISDSSDSPDDCTFKLPAATSTDLTARIPKISFSKIILSFKRQSTIDKDGIGRIKLRHRQVWTSRSKDLEKQLEPLWPIPNMTDTDNVSLLLIWTDQSP